MQSNCRCRGFSLSALTKVPSGAFSPTVLRWQASPTSATLARPEPSSRMLLLLTSLQHWRAPCRHVVMFRACLQSAPVHINAPQTRQVPLSESARSCTHPPVHNAAGMKVRQTPSCVERQAAAAIAPQQRRPQNCIAQQPPQVAPDAVPVQADSNFVVWHTSAGILLLPWLYDLYETCT